MSTSTEAPPVAPDTLRPRTSIRLAALYRSAILDREEQLRPAVEALKVAETDEEIAAASGELVAVTDVAEAEFARRIDRAKTHLAETPAP